MAVPRRQGGVADAEGSRDLSLGAAFGGLAGGFEGAGAAAQDEGERPGPWLWQKWPCGAAATSTGASVHAGRPLHELVQHLLAAHVLGEKRVEQRRQLLPVELPVPVLVEFLTPAVELRLGYKDRRESPTLTLRLRPTLRPVGRSISYRVSCESLTLPLVRGLSLGASTPLRLLLLLVKDPLLVQRRLPFHSRRRLDLQHHGAYAPVRAAPIPLRRRLTAVRRNSSAYCVGTSLLPGGGRFQRTTRDLQHESRV